jgi:hypothetical protein
MHQAALGDFALIWPLLRVLDGPTVLVADRPRAEVAANRLSGVIPIGIDQPAFTTLHAPDARRRLSEDWRAWWGQARRVISFVSGGGDTWAENIRALAPESARFYLATRPPTDWRGHVISWHRQQLDDQGLRLPEAPGLPLVRHPGPLAAHPGSGGQNKCWPRPRFEGLIERLAEEGLSVRPLLGEAEWARWGEDVVQHWRRRFGARLCGGLNELVDALDEASGFIGNDAGPTHLAAQLGLPTLSLFGPTTPEHWAPVGPGVHVLAPDSPREMDWLRLERAHGAARELFAGPARGDIYRDGDG